MCEREEQNSTLLHPGNVRSDAAALGLLCCCLLDAHQSFGKSLKLTEKTLPPPPLFFLSVFLNKLDNTVSFSLEDDARSWAHLDTLELHETFSTPPPPQKVPACSPGDGQQTIQNPGLA